MKHFLLTMLLTTIIFAAALETRLGVLDEGLVLNIDPNHTSFTKNVTFTMENNCVIYAEISTEWSPYVSDSKIKVEPYEEKCPYEDSATDIYGMYTVFNLENSADMDADLEEIEGSETYILSVPAGYNIQLLRTISEDEMYEEDENIRSYIANDFVMAPTHGEDPMVIDVEDDLSPEPGSF